MFEKRHSKEDCISEYDLDSCPQYTTEICQSKYPSLKVCPTECEECVPCEEDDQPELFIISLPMPKSPETSIGQHHLHISEISFTDASGNSIDPIGCMESSATSTGTCDLTYDGNTNTFSHTFYSETDGFPDEEIHMLQYQLPHGSSLSSITITNRSGFNDRFIGANLLYVRNNEVVWAEQVRNSSDTMQFSIAETFNSTIHHQYLSIPRWIWVAVILICIIYYYRRR